MTTMQIFILLCGLAAVLYGLITSRQILSLSPGNERMQEIAKAIGQCVKQRNLIYNEKESENLERKIKY
jgi:Na+/H+-translocating membrane pyrophosphatase